MAIVYLSLGSNLGDRVGYLQQAASLIGAIEDIKIVATSSFYETEPWNMPTDNWFVNAIVQISTSLTPIELLSECHRIERQLGRVRFDENKYEDRTIDIDILFYDDLVINNETLVIPHKHFHKRAFLLVPMLEIAQDFIHPIYKKTVSELYEELENPEMVYLYGTRV
ncbi:2-amino-4-hydroxy-6-hydroxymethyldihydropteridine diphosphokinase [bacterium]|nr:2-amino-4-hydroxy-6-hydroxymethyldihydropteridine diphosphokinase [bacterium]